MSGFRTQTQHFSASAAHQLHSPQQSHSYLLCTGARKACYLPATPQACNGWWDTAVPEDTANLPDNLSARQEIKTKITWKQLSTQIGLKTKQKNKLKKASSIRLSDMTVT